MLFRDWNESQHVSGLCLMIGPEWALYDEI
jgi:hypothetical protein